MREDLLHFNAREYFRREGWILLAGEYPNGSDDELYPLAIKDPLNAEGFASDHRKHSDNKLIPDLVVIRNNLILVIEIKPKFSKSDEGKLENLFLNRFAQLKISLNEHILRYFSHLKIDLNKCKPMPCLCFEGPNYIKREKFAYLLFNKSEGNIILPEGV